MVRSGPVARVVNLSLDLAAIGAGPPRAGPDGGDIDLRDTDAGTGATFEVTLPVADAEAPALLG